LDKIQALQTGMDTKLGETQDELKKRFSDFDDKQKRSQVSLELKMAVSGKED